MYMYIYIYIYIYNWVTGVGYLLWQKKQFEFGK